MLLHLILAHKLDIYILAEFVLISLRRKVPVATVSFITLKK